VTSSFRREVDEICALLGYHAAYSGNSLQTFRDNLSVQGRKSHEDPEGARKKKQEVGQTHQRRESEEEKREKTEMSGNVGKKLPQCSR
jgi:hypothetical protein